MSCKEKGVLRWLGFACGRILAYGPVDCMGRVSEDYDWQRDVWRETIGGG